MSVSSVSRVRDLVIASGAAVSNVLNARLDYGDAVGIGLQAPAAVDTVTYKWQVSVDGTTWADYQAGATLADLAIPGAGNAAVYEEIVAFPFIRLAASGNAAADRTFLVSKHYTMS